jgi:hypothetical protein
VIILFFSLTILGILLIEPCVAPVTVPANPKSGPEIASVVINNDPVWSPPLIITDPYTGEVTYSAPGCWVQNGNIEITIKNRPFTAYTNENGNLVNIYYCVFIKDAKNSPLFATTPKRTVYQSNSDYTVITFTYNDDEIALPDIYVTRENIVLDFRVQAVIGYFNVGTRPQYFDAVYEGEGTRYSEFTITIPSTNEVGTSKPNIKPTSVVPSTPDFNTLHPSNNTNPPLQTPYTYYLIIILITLYIIILPLVIVTYLNKRQQRKNSFAQTAML